MDEQAKQSDSNMWTVRRVLNWSTDFLAGCGSPTAKLDSEVLLAKDLECRRVDLYAEFDRPLSLSEREKYRSSIRRRSTGEPVAYITGAKSFWRTEFAVDARVLIPRPETETLMETALASSRHFKIPVRKILDIGTGSGCLAISLAGEFAEASVEAWDVSSKALEVAALNVSSHGLEDRIVLKCVDVMQALQHDQAFDLIVTNPPYIGEYERDMLPKSVLGFEPSLALFADDEGKQFYQYFAANCYQWLRPGGLFLAEFGQGQGDYVVSLFRDHGWSDVQTISDLAGIERVLMAKRGRDDHESN
jgi:release factor glutamine methyltransferase